MQPAYVLHVRRFRESSQIVELLTAEKGRVGLLAKGAASAKSPLRCMLQPFIPLLVDWRGRGELPTLVAAEQALKVDALSGRQLYCGLYINELVLKLTQRSDPHSGLFQDYVEAINALLQTDGSNDQIEPILRRFELQLLTDLGLGLQLQHDCHGDPVQESQRYEYDLESGLRPIQGNNKGVSGLTILGLLGKTDSVGLPERKEARALLRRILAHHLGGQVLKSRELFA